MKNFIHKIMQGCGARIFPIPIFLSLLTMAEPSLSHMGNCKIHNYRTVDVIENGNRTRYCLMGRERNQNGAIYKIGIPHTDQGATIYGGKSGDAILETTVFSRKGSYNERAYGSWRRSGNEFYFQFPSGIKIYIPVF
ncbi:MAG: hypothetical protein SWX82_08330 [Cyanobacteriota bacterium]|nr:hypothetical protein [Cyanobacteriota bacterium]